MIYLASQSPRRRELLSQLGIEHELLLPGDDEDSEALEAVRNGGTLEQAHQLAQRMQEQLQLLQLQITEQLG